MRPDISGNLVVWEGWDGNDYEIYSMDISHLIVETDTVPSLNVLGIGLLGGLLGLMGLRRLRGL